MFGIELETSTIVIVAGFLLALALAPVWAHFVGWHLRIRHHVWVLPAMLLVLIPGGILAYAQYETLSMTLFAAGVALGVFFHFVVGASCPDCGDRLKCKRPRYGPITYRCKSCSFKWTGWTMKDELPD